MGTAWGSVSFVDTTCQRPGIKKNKKEEKPERNQVKHRKRMPGVGEIGFGDAGKKKKKKRSKGWPTVGGIITKRDWGGEFKRCVKDHSIPSVQKETL